MCDVIMAEKFSEFMSDTLTTDLGSQESTRRINTKKNLHQHILSEEPRVS